MGFKAELQRLNGINGIAIIHSGLLEMDYDGSNLKAPCPNCGEGMVVFIHSTISICPKCGAKFSKAGAIIFYAAAWMDDEEFRQETEKIKEELIKTREMTNEQKSIT